MLWGQLLTRDGDVACQGASSQSKDKLEEAITNLRLEWGRQGERLKG